MFELSVACKYLIPRRRQLSVSIISLISVLVIALVVWLIVVFFSVTDGLEKNWVQKLIALTAPVRITPKDAYYHSYYYQIDSISEKSNYSLKTIGEKQAASLTDPYDATVDEETPSYWHTPDLDQEGKLKDLVKLTFSSLDEIKNVPGLRAKDFELTATHIDLRLLRPSAYHYAQMVYGGSSQSSLSYPAYLGIFDTDSGTLGNTLLEMQVQDFNNVFSLLGAVEGETVDKETFHKRLNNFFNLIDVQELKARPTGWLMPRRLYPIEAHWQVCVLLKNQKIARVVVPLKGDTDNLRKELEGQGATVMKGAVHVNQGEISLTLANGETHFLPQHFSLTVAAGDSFPVHLDPSSLEKAKTIEDVRFDAEIPVQGEVIKGKIAFRGLEISNVKQLPIEEKATPWWIYERGNQLTLPKDPINGEGIALPKSFRDAGVLIGDRGSLSYYSPTASTIQEQQIPIFVAGFYDPGIIPIGGKYILASRETTSLIRASHQADDKTAMTNGINVRFDDLNQADAVKAQLLAAFKRKGIEPYWNVETYREYEFTREIIHELQSQKNLFMLIAVVIIIVACSNIISMLVILVNDKKAEIGILRSMGASSKSIALIFGTAGAMIGVVGSLLGIIASLLTLHHLDSLVSFLSKMQGHEMFSSHFYGKSLPHELSYEALFFVLMATVFISLLAGIVPAIKACLLRPTHILRSGG